MPAIAPRRSRRKEQIVAKKRRVLLLLHKKSGARPEVKQAISDLKDRGIKVNVQIPWSRKDCRRIIKEAIKDGATRIVSGGGDGTLNGIVNVLMTMKQADPVSLGVLPLGTANDFARGAGLPLNDLSSALHIAAVGEATPIDIGQANDRFFINVASGGFGAEVTATTPQDMKLALGGAAYSIMGLVKVLQLKPYVGRIIFADGTAKKWEMVVMAVGNSRFAGGAFEVAPRASLTDGLLDLTALAPVKAIDLGEVAAELIDQFNEANRFLFYRQLSSFVIESDRPLHMNLDGEPMVDNRFAFDAHPRALPVVLGNGPQPLA